MDPATFHRFLAELEAPFGAPSARWREAEVTLTGAGALPSVYAVTDLAAASVAAAGRAAARLVATHGGSTGGVAVDTRLASMWFAFTIAPQGWELPSPWDSIAGDYPTADGWIKLHTNAPHHRAAALEVLGCRPGADRGEVGAVVARRPGAELEREIVAAGGCAAQLRSEADWAAHPQGQAVAAEPIVDLEPGGTAPTPDRDRPSDPARPLAGVRVLDLTRVLAGPVATRFLAGLGADVLRIDPPHWDEPAIVPEVVRGKRCARLDLRRDEDAATLRRLLGQADLLVHGYRPGALDGLGLAADERQRLAPGLVDVALDAYGWTGPLAGRRGFDSLVQLSSGIAHTGMVATGADRPRPLPVQALDHATGYLLAAAALHGWVDRLEQGRGTIGRASLARTAATLVAGPRTDPDTELASRRAADHEEGVEDTPWGPARRLRPPVTIPGTSLAWDRPPLRWATNPRPSAGFPEP